ncbi:MAG: hypothetical protein WC374_01715 [Phycisphaerae bacterium]|jgi:hypothetical protein
MNYLFILYILIFVALGIRWIYLSSKLEAYINKNLPAKAKELDYAAPHSIKFQKLVYKKDDVNDPIYIRLRERSKNAGILLLLIFISVPLLMLFYTIAKSFMN